MIFLYASFETHETNDIFFDNFGTVAKNAVLGCIFVLVLMYKQKNINFSIISFIAAKIGKQNEYWMILDNLEESIIILDVDSKIDFVNEKFLELFKAYIDVLELPRPKLI